MKQVAIPKAVYTGSCNQLFDFLAEQLADFIKEQEARHKVMTAGSSSSSRGAAGVSTLVVATKTYRRVWELRKVWAEQQRPCSRRHWQAGNSLRRIAQAEPCAAGGMQLAAVHTSASSATHSTPSLPHHHARGVEQLAGKQHGCSPRRIAQVGEWCAAGRY